MHVGGTFDEVKAMHRRLDPSKVIYSVYPSSPDEAERMLDWFVENT